MRLIFWKRRIATSFGIRNRALLLSNQIRLAERQVIRINQVYLISQRIRLFDVTLATSPIVAGHFEKSGTHR